MAFEIENPSEKKSLLFGIVTYKEKYWECDSYISLLELFKKVNKEDEILFFWFLYIKKFKVVIFEKKSY